MYFMFILILFFSVNVFAVQNWVSCSEANTHSITEVWTVKSVCEFKKSDVCVDISGKDMRRFKCENARIIADSVGAKAVDDQEAARLAKKIEFDSARAREKTRCDALSDGPEKDRCIVYLGR